MNKSIHFPCAVVLMCIVFVGCHDDDVSIPEPDTHIVEYVSIINGLESDDITIDMRNGWSVTIKPGEEKTLVKREFTFPWGGAFDPGMLMRYTDMVVRGEVVHEDIWWPGLHWTILREDGEDEYHYTRIFTLNVTEELLEKFRVGENEL